MLGKIRNPHPKSKLALTKQKQTQIGTTTSTCESMACRKIRQLHNLVVAPVAVAVAVAFEDPIEN